MEVFFDRVTRPFLFVMVNLSLVTLFSRTFNQLLLARNNSSEDELSRSRGPSEPTSPCYTKRSHHNSGGGTNSAGEETSNTLPRAFGHHHTRATSNGGQSSNLVRSNSTGTNAEGGSLSSSDYGFQDWRRLKPRSAALKNKGGHQRQKHGKSVRFGENRISVFMRQSEAASSGQSQQSQPQQPTLEEIIRLAIEYAEKENRRSARHSSYKGQRNEQHSALSDSEALREDQQRMNHSNSRPNFWSDTERRNNNSSDDDLDRVEDDEFSSSVHPADRETFFVGTNKSAALNLLQQQPFSPPMNQKLYGLADQPQQQPTSRPNHHQIRKRGQQTSEDKSMKDTLDFIDKVLKSDSGFGTEAEIEEALDQLKRHKEKQKQILVPLLAAMAEEETGQQQPQNQQQVNSTTTGPSSVVNSNSKPTKHKSKSRSSRTSAAFGGSMTSNNLYNGHHRRSAYRQSLFLGHQDQASTTTTTSTTSGHHTSPSGSGSTTSSCSLRPCSVDSSSLLRHSTTPLPSLSIESSAGHRTTGSSNNASPLTTKDAKEVEDEDGGLGSRFTPEEALAALQTLTRLTTASSRENYKNRIKMIPPSKRGLLSDEDSDEDEEDERRRLRRNAFEEEFDDTASILSLASQLNRHKRPTTKASSSATSVKTRRGHQSSSSRNRFRPSAEVCDQISLIFCAQL